MRIAAVLASLLLLAACGSEEEVLVAPDASTTTTLGAIADADATAVSDAPVVTEPESTAVSTVPPAPPATAADALDPCLVGSWIMKQDSLDVMAATAVPFAGIQIPSGGMSLNLDEDGTVATDAKFTAVFAMADTTAEADVYWKHSGTWTTADGVLVMEITAQKAGITEVRQAGIALPGPPLDPVDPINGGPYECSADQLIINSTNGATVVPMSFER